MHLVNGIPKAGETVTLQHVVGSIFLNLPNAGVQSLFDQVPNRALIQAIGGRIHWNHATRVDHVSLRPVQHLMLRRFEDDIPAKHVHLAADSHAHTGFQSFGKPGLVEPHDPNIASFVSEHGLSRFPTRPHAGL